MSIEITPKKVVYVLGGIFALLMVANGAGIISTYVFHHGTLKGLVPLFDFDTDGNIPNYFSAFILLLSALLFFAVAIASRQPGKRDHRYWAVLGFIFVYMSVDEAIRLHERLVIPLQHALNASGVLYFAWVIPYGIAALVLGVVYLRFIWRLPSRTRWLLIAAGVLYVSGALGMELIGGEYYDVHNGRPDIIYAMMTFVEETLEPVGIMTLIYALLYHLQTSLGGIRLEVKGLASIAEVPATREAVGPEPVPTQAISSAR